MEFGHGMLQLSQPKNRSSPRICGGFLIPAISVKIEKCQGNLKVKRFTIMGLDPNGRGLQELKYSHSCVKANIVIHCFEFLGRCLKK